MAKTLHLVVLSRKIDFTYEATGLILWAAAETALTIVAVSLTTLRPLLSLNKRRSRCSEAADELNPSSHGHKPSNSGNSFSTVSGKTDRSSVSQETSIHQEKSIHKESKIQEESNDYQEIDIHEEITIPQEINIQLESKDYQDINIDDDGSDNGILEDPLFRKYM